jgi:ferrochelatase
MRTQIPSQSPKTGVLVINLGSPSAPTAEALKPYLAEFLSDPYVVDYPRWLWMPVLKGIILRTRPARSAALYRRIWTEQGSPLITLTESIGEKLSRQLNRQGEGRFAVAAGMRYGSPTIRGQIETLLSEGIQRMVVLPLFPQYSTTTTQTALDVVHAVLDYLAPGFEVETVTSYHNHAAYLEALAESIRQDWSAHGKPDKVLLSFHGVPERYCKFDPYEEQCKQTAVLLAAKLELQSGQWAYAFQSRFGPEAWVQPYTDKVLAKWGKSGIRSVSVAAPGFAVDCLETIDELGREANEVFLNAGGESFRYIPALNDSQPHIDALESILRDAARLYG